MPTPMPTPIPTPIPPRCRHLHTDGRQCGSPALRDKPLCFQHDPLRRPMPLRKLEGRVLPQLPAPDDFLAIQRGLGDVLRLLALDQLTDRRASALIRGYATASQNLVRHLREERLLLAAEHPAPPVTDCVNDPELGTLALPEPALDTPIPIQGNQDLSPSEESSPTPQTVLLSEGEAAAEAAAEVPAAAPAAPPATNLRAFPTPKPHPLPAPHPQPRFTPLTAETTLEEELTVGEMYTRLDQGFRDKTHAFTQEKTAELEAEFERKLQTRLETELEARLEALNETRLEADIAHFFTQQPNLHPAVS